MDFPSVLERPLGGGRLREWLRANAEQVEALITANGAVLFRGFEVSGPEEFYDVVTGPLGELMQYIEGASPRTPLGKGVYTSTEYAPDQTVALHNELSYSSQWPGRVAFYCKTPAEHGGQTPIADSRKVFRRIVDVCPIPPPTAVRYVRHMHDGKGPGVGWPTVFATCDAAQVETRCRETNIGFAWLPDRTLRTVQVRPAAIVHPLTAEKVWFNQAHQWHPSNGGEETETLWREVFGEQLPMHAVHSDGTEIDQAVLKTIRSAYQAERVMFDWQAGDLMILDNMLTAHGRSPFTGRRDVMVAMGRPVHLTEVEEVKSYG